MSRLSALAKAAERPPPSPSRAGPRKKVGREAVGVFATPVDPEVRAELDHLIERSRRLLAQISAVAQRQRLARSGMALQQQATAVERLPGELRAAVVGPLAGARAAVAEAASLLSAALEGKGESPGGAPDGGQEGPAAPSALSVLSAAIQGSASVRAKAELLRTKAQALVDLADGVNTDIQQLQQRLADGAVDGMTERGKRLRDRVSSVQHAEEALRSALLALVRPGHRSVATAPLPQPHSPAYSQSVVAKRGLMASRQSSTSQPFISLYAQSHTGKNVNKRAVIDRRHPLDRWLEELFRNAQVSLSCFCSVSLLTQQMMTRPQGRPITGYEDRVWEDVLTRLGRPVRDDPKGQRHQGPAGGRAPTRLPAIPGSAQVSADRQARRDEAVSLPPPSSQQQRHQRHAPTLDRESRTSEGGESVDTDILIGVDRSRCYYDPASVAKQLKVMAIKEWKAATAATRSSRAAAQDGAGGSDGTIGWGGPIRSRGQHDSAFFERRAQGGMWASGQGTSRASSPDRGMRSGLVSPYVDPVLGPSELANLPTWPRWAAR